MTPVAASVAAFPVERVQPAHWPDHPWNWLAWSEFLHPFNMSGQPAAKSVPHCGFTLPDFGQTCRSIGKRFDDLGVLRLAAAFQAAMPLHAVPVLPTEPSALGECPDVADRVADDARS